MENELSAPEKERVEEWREPIVRARVLAPVEYVSYVEKLCSLRRGVKVGEEAISDGTVELSYEMPLA